MLATRNYLVAYIGNRLVACQAEKIASDLDGLLQAGAW